MKILSPAGNLESLKVAVYNGADEVYLGINNFNARNNIDGFDLESLKEAIDFAHIFDVKVHLAINILFKDEELEQALNTIIKAYNLGVDAFIVQDIGLASLVHKHFPQIELHASTQMGIHNLEGVKAIENLGFKRIVLARETPLAEIKRIRDNSNVEIEYFAQGALCVCFSGNCYLSSYLCNASGNRGKCKQLCRLPYSFMYQNKVLGSGYLLSAKDFCMAGKIKELKDAGVTAIKIEGRARRPSYVGIVTREYKKLLTENKLNMENIKLAFNREFTAGYFDGNGKIISKYNNHIGIFVGKVEDVKLGKKFNEIFVYSQKKLTPKSTFKFFREDREGATISAYDLTETKKNHYRITTTKKACVGDNVNLILDSNIEEKVLSYKKKRKVIIEIFAIQNKPIKANILLGGKSYEVVGDVCQVAQNSPLTAEELAENFNKSDLFEASVNATLENVFIPKKQLNDFRRKVFEKAFDIITSGSQHNLKTISLVQLLNSNETNEKQKNFQVQKFENFEIVENYEKLGNCKNIVYSPEKYEIKDIKSFVAKCQNEGKIPFLDTPNFVLAQDYKHLSEIVEETKISVVANNYYALNFNTNIVIGAGLNVYNHISANYYNKPIITAESDISTKINLPYMTLRHCPLKANLGASCDKCPYKNGYYYKMESGKILRLKRKKLSTCTFYLTD